MAARPSTGGAARPSTTGTGRSPSLPSIRSFPPINYHPLLDPLKQRGPKLTTYGYAMLITKNRGKLAFEAKPRPIRTGERERFDAYIIRPERALTVYQIIHKAGNAPLSHLAELAKQQGTLRETAPLGCSLEELEAERKLFDEQAEVLATLQWENPLAIFDSIDEDKGGTLSMDELKEGLMGRGLSEKMVEPILRDFDVDGDGEISRDEWKAGFYASRLCTVPQPPNEDFADLAGTEQAAGCTIKQVEMRAVTLRQLRELAKHIARRCGSESWKNLHKEKLTPATVTLYDAMRYVIRPATFARQCSYVELVAIRAQRPKYFVAHWWGEPIKECQVALLAHAKDRMPNLALDGGYWVSAYATSPWAVGSADPSDKANDPTRSAFHKAIALSEGTVVVVDQKGGMFERVWCNYEAYVALGQQQQKSTYLFDVYTSTSEGHAGRGVGLSDGSTVGDISNTMGTTKKSREEKFPLGLLDHFLRIGIEGASATVDSDRVRILNRLANVPELDAPPLAESPKYELVNAAIRARFAAAGLVRAYSAGPETSALQQHMLHALSEGRLKQLELNFDSCQSFTEETARKLAAKLPKGLVSLSLRTNGFGDVFIGAMCRNFTYAGGFDTIKVLDLEGNMISGLGLTELSKHARSGFLKGLAALKLDRNLIEDTEVAHFGRSLTMSEMGGHLTALTLEDNRIGDKGCVALVKLFVDKNAVPKLDTIRLRGNPASKMQLDAVYKAHKAGGRGVKTPKPGDSGAARKRPEEGKEGKGGDGMKKSLSLEELNASGYGQ